MPNNPVSFLRTLAASLICVSGIGQIAALWLRELNGTALADGLLGSVYLIIGIGLFGQSRFSLFLAIIIPATAISVILYTQPQPEQPYNLHIAIDLVVVLCSTIELWRVRHNTSE
jgi:hypothetical protein